MISLQILNKILNTQDTSMLGRYALTEEYFAGYENEYNFIITHQENYGNVPDKATFLDKFPEFELIDVSESDEYLVNKIREENLYYKSVEVVQEVADRLKTDADDAVNYLLTQVETLKPSQVITGVDIISNAKQRLESHLNKKIEESPYYIPTGFKELDNLLGGWARGEEFVVFFARTGMGKSWMLIATMANAWANNYRVGYISPEMSPTKTGYRFDTIFKNFSNKALVRGNDVDGYEDYINTISKSETPFLVATPKDFQKNITVSKLRSFCINNKIDILAIDGITYLRDERRQRGDNKTTMLTNISEDLMSLSNELGIPILTVVQSNREGVKADGEDGVPELENIRDSDGIAYNATKVISLKQNSGCLQVAIKKHRDGEMGGILNYTWNIDTGEFRFLPSAGDYSVGSTTSTPNYVRKPVTSDTDVF
jgi:replicative DNA helicase